MAIIVHTDRPRSLLRAIYLAVDAGKVRTWSYDQDGDLTHAVTQWRDQAWFQPRVLLDRLVFNIVAPRGTTLLGVTYAVYHGRFAEMLLAHFDTHFERINLTSMPTDNDTV